MASQITPRQCKQARSLLKWNVQDLAVKAKLYPKQIERFEKSLTRVTMPEMDAMVKIFKQEGIQFLDNMDVILAKDENNAHNRQDRHQLSSIEEKVYEVTTEELHGISAAALTTADQDKPRKPKRPRSNPLTPPTQSS